MGKNTMPINNKQDKFETGSKTMPEKIQNNLEQNTRCSAITCIYMALHRQLNVTKKMQFYYVYYYGKNTMPINNKQDKFETWSKNMPEKIQNNLEQNTLLC